MNAIRDISSFNCNKSTKLWWIISLLVLTQIQADCPNEIECRCETKTDGITINCRSNNLVAIPVFNNTSETFAELTLSRNQIEKIQANAFKTVSGDALNVRKIDLDRNKIDSIDDDAFHGLGDNLKELVLHVESVSNFPIQALGQLSELEKLFLEGFNSEHPENVFDNLHKLEELGMTSCGLIGISDADLEYQKDSLTALTLESNHFASIPTDALVSLSGLLYLDMRDNVINNLSKNAFEGISSLTELLLSQNGFDFIHPETFMGLENTLQTLELSLTNFHHSYLPSISVLHSLEELDLSGNSLLSELPDDVFVGLNNLAVLNLHGCGISHLKANSFKGLGTTLLDLDLVSNGITSIDNNAFQDLQSLQVLHLDGDGQNLSATLTSPSKFNGLENTLEFLSLDRTSLTTGNLASIQNLSNLKILKLNQNDISSIPWSTFTNLGQLEFLELSSNSIQTVSQQAMQGLQNSLKEINLNNNNIKTLDECVFFEFKHLTRIDLASNPLTCDCKIRWLREWLDDNQNGDRTVAGKCSLPQEIEDKDISEIPSQNFTCDIEQEPVVCDIKSTHPSTLSTTPSIQTTPTPTTTPTSSSDKSSPSQPPNIIFVNITEVRDISFRVSWTVSSSMTAITGFKMEVMLYDTSDIEQEHEYDSEARDDIITDLIPLTRYRVCISTLHHSNTMDNYEICNDATTKMSSVPEESPPQIGVIIGSIVAFVILMALITAFIFFVHQHRNHLKDPVYNKAKPPALPPGRNKLPRVNTQSFKKTRDNFRGLEHHISNQPTDRTLHVISQDEMHRAQDLFTTSNNSITSSLPAQRYVQEPVQPPGVVTYPSGQSFYPTGQTLSPSGQSFHPASAYNYNPRQEYNYPQHRNANPVSVQEEGPYEEIPANAVSQNQDRSFHSLNDNMTRLLDISVDLPDSSSKWI